MSEKIIAFVEASTTGTGELYWNRARELGLRPLLITNRAHAYPFVGPHDVIETDTTSMDGIRGAAVKAGALGVMTAVWSSSDTQIENAARIAAGLHLPHADADAIAHCRDKYACRRAMAAAGLPTPRFALISSATDGAQFFEDGGSAVIIKPRASTGSIGVKLCATGAEAARHATQLLDLNGPGSVVAEEYVDGDEFSVEMFNGQAVGVTRKHLGKKPHFIEIGHDFPAAVSAPTAAELASTAERAVQSVGLSAGPAHVEVRLRGDRAYIIEINARVAGGCIPELVRLACGYDLVVAAIQFATGGRYQTPKQSMRATAVRFLMREPHRKTESVEEIASARNTPGVAAAGLYRNALLRTGEVEDFRDRLAWVIGEGQTAQQAARAAEKGLGKLRIRNQVEKANCHV